MTVATNIECAGANPLISGSDAPYGTMPFTKLTASDYEQGILEGMKIQNQEIEAICNQRSVPTFENTIVALDRSGRVLNRSVMALSNLEHATGDTTLMNTLTKLTPAMSDHSANIMLNERLFDRIKQVYDLRDKDTSLNDEDRRLIEKTYRSFVHSGANLKGDDRDKFRRLNAELSDLNVRFSQNVTNAMKDTARRMWLKADDLTGIPESIKSAYRAAAAEALADEGKPDDGSLYLVTIFRPSLGPFMMYSDRRDLREKLYKLNASTNMSGEFNNMQIL